MSALACILSFLATWAPQPPRLQPPPSAGSSTTPAAPLQSLQSLQSLFVERLFVREPLAKASGQGEPGSTAMLPVAQIVDARFASNGQLTALVVTALDRALTSDPTMRLLPAAEVAFDAGSGRWCLLRRELAIASLPEHRAETAAANGGRRTGPEDYSASQLLTATAVVRSIALPPPKAAPTGTKGDQAAKGPGDGKAVPEPVIWWVDVTGPVRIELAALPATDRALLVSWNAVRLARRGDGLAVATSLGEDTLADAPATKTRTERPDADQRRRARVHSGDQGPQPPTPPPVPAKGA